MKRNREYVEKLIRIYLSEYGYSGVNFSVDKDEKKYIIIMEKIPLFLVEILKEVVKMENINAEIKLE